MSFNELQEFIQNSQNVATVDDLVNVLLRHVKPMGYDRMIFCLLSDHTHIGLSAGVGHLSNYPQEWMTDYKARGFDRIDPVITTLRASSRTFTWDEMAKTLPLTKEQKLCLSMGEEAKLYNGVATPIWGPNRFSALGFATCEKNDACDVSTLTLDILNAFSHHFYLVFERLQQRHCKPEELKHIHLTAQEHIVLSWAVKGKSNSVIADLMTISVSTVKFHMRNIYKKLGVYDRAPACAKALAMGLVQLY